MTRPLTGRGVLFYLLGFFAIVMAVNFYYAAIAVKTFRGEDDLKPYQEGVEYNQTLARRAEQEKLGWKAEFDVARLNPQRIHLTVRVVQANGAPAAKASLGGELRHPSDENRDQQLKLTEVGPGDYEADVTGITSGAWDVIVHTPESGTPFEATRRIFVP